MVGGGNVNLALQEMVAINSFWSHAPRAFQKAIGTGPSFYLYYYLVNYLSFALKLFFIFTLNDL